MRPRREAKAPAPDDLKRQEFEELRSAKAGVKVAVAPQLSPTQIELAIEVVKAVDIPPGHRVLEPSAGTGRLRDPLFNMDGTEPVIMNTPCL
jgi:hypothetical protein